MLFDLNTTARQLIVHLDLLIKKQLTVILDDTKFQELLANWSCLFYLIEVAEHSSIKVKILDLKWCEIDYLCSTDDTLDGLFAQKILDQLDMPGSDPLSFLIGSYYLDVSSKADVDTLTHIATICAHAFVPFISSITHRIFDVTDFSHVTRMNFTQIQKNPKFKYLVKLADDINTNFIGLVLPRILFPSLLTRVNDLSYCPVLGEGITTYKQIFGNGVYAVAAVVVSSVINTGWFFDIVGLPSDDDLREEVGVIPGLTPPSFFEWPKLDYIFRMQLTEFFISEHLEKELANIGFISLCQVKNRDFAVLYNASSLRTLSLRITETTTEGSLQYVLCICRFAHYLKILGRQKLGLYSNVQDFKYFLNKWLQNYIASDPETPLELKYRYPLLSGRVEVFEDDFLRNNYRCVVHLRPHLLSTHDHPDITLETRFVSMR